MKYALSIFIGIIFTTLVGVFVAHAQDYTPLAPLPIGPGGTTLTTYTLSSYLSGMLKLIIALGAGVSILVAIIGGTQYVAAGIAPSAKQDAKERIWNSLIGLTLILTSWLILNSINPNLVKFELDLPPIAATPPPTTPPGGGTCSIPPLTPLSEDARRFENGTTVYYRSSNTDVQRNLTELEKEVGKLQVVINALGGTMVVNSAYRPVSYQKHLWEVLTKWNKQGLKTNNDPACASLKNEVGAEYSRHGLGSVVSSPSGCAPHVKGTGVDINISGVTRNINEIMNENGINLYWPNITSDPVHFNLKRAPYAGCASI